VTFEFCRSYFECFLCGNGNSSRYAILLCVYKYSVKPRNVFSTLVKYLWNGCRRLSVGFRDKIEISQR
jgi:hypothetical protein